MSNGIEYKDFLNRICNNWNPEIIQELYKKYNKSQDKPLDITFFIENVDINIDDKMWVLCNSKFIDEKSARKLAYLYADRAVQQEKNTNSLVLKNLKALYNKIYNDNPDDIEDLRIELLKNIISDKTMLNKKFYESSLSVYNAGNKDFEKAVSDTSNSGRRILMGTVVKDEYEFQINLYKKMIKI